MSNLYDDYKEEKKEKVLYDTNNVSNKNNRKPHICDRHFAVAAI